MQAYGRWVVIGILVLLSSLQFPYVSSEEAVHSEGSASINNTEAAEMECVSKHLSFIDIVLSISNNTSTCTGSTIDFNVTLADKGSLRPKCDEASGCNVPLNCFNFRELDNGSSVIPDPPQALLVTPHQLEDIVETTSVQNCCAVVLFYAPWCTFSVQFARKFNALGRSFDSLPILAVDLAENDPYVQSNSLCGWYNFILWYYRYKYILAYLPLVAFYYRGKTLFKFNLESSFEELRDTITNITGFCV